MAYMTAPTKNTITPSQSSFMAETTSFLLFYTLTSNVLRGCGRTIERHGARAVHETGAAQEKILPGSGSNSARRAWRPADRLPIGADCRHKWQGLDGLHTGVDSDRIGPEDGALHLPAPGARQRADP